MAVTFGFFNSIESDRVYNADQMSTFFKGLVSQGIYNNVGGKFQVVANSGLTIQVKSGRAVIGDFMKWVENDAALNITLNAAHVTLNRYTAVVIRLNNANREVVITTKDGANASDPVKPSMQNDANIRELCLAYIYVPAGTTVITQSNIQDTRSNKSLCGWITGLIDQVDTTTLFEQWSTAYDENIAEMNAWEVSMKSQFDTWLNALTQQLSVNTFIQSFQKTVTIGENDSTTIPLDMLNYSYETSDIFIVTINGLMCIQNVDYTINTLGTQITVNLTHKNNEVVNIRVLKSRIGFYVLGDNLGNAIGTGDGDLIMM